ncbi:DUF6398 domain-containing protein [Rhodopirellula halodulae]|uniref:DUF6398 domain-containing protein n=1 Tax=Rhodopirellula halodulae TaxID=2894198 RepID=UPI001E606189|nr:DUF6398 domain-containing protein [Rhodopirellula sp. JC737]MCC9658324.1 DUF6398 domain-containing protein [Rhodopirellula sp. JC737]
MSGASTLNDIPMPFRERYTDIVEIVEAFCRDHLNDEYFAVSRELAAHVCQEGSPVRSGKASSWAAGILWAVGRVNFLSDPASEPCMTQSQFAKAIGVSVATISAKCRVIWDGMELMQLDPRFSIASQQDSNPLVWMAEVNGFLMDLRTAPREIQEAAFEQGVIPYVPDARSDEASD